MSATKIKRKFLTVEQKTALVAFAEKNKFTVRQLAHLFGVGKSQVSAILKKQDEIKKMYMESENLQQKKKFLKTEGVAIDTIVYDWFCESRKNNIPLSKTMIKEKAQEVAKQLNIDCKGSDGWLEKFCNRHNLTNQEIYGTTSGTSLRREACAKLDMTSYMSDSDFPEIKEIQVKYCM